MQQTIPSERPDQSERAGGVAAAVAALGHGIVSVLDLAHRMVIERGRRARRARRARRQLEAMIGLGPRQLADIGLDRADVQAVLWGGVPASQIGHERATAGTGTSRGGPWPAPDQSAPRTPVAPAPYDLPEAA